MKRALNVIVSLGVLGLLIWWADAGAVWAHLRGAAPGWLAAAAAALSCVTILMAKRWQLIARAFALQLGFAQAVGEYYIAQLLNLVLPGGVLGDVARAVRVRHGADLTKAAQSVAADRIIGQAVMLGLLWIGMSVALIVPGGIAWPSVAWVALAAGLGVLLVCCLMSRRDGATGRFLRMVWHLTAHFRLLALSLVIAALLIFSVYACARATGTRIPAQGWLTLIPLILSAMMIPLSVGGWGWREGAGAALFPLIGADASAGIATGIAYGAMMMLCALPGLYFAWRSTGALTLKPQT